MENKKKGVVYQIQGVNVVDYREFDLKELGLLLHEYQEKRKVRLKELEEISKQNARYLTERAQKLNKPVPMELLLYLDPVINNGTPHVSLEFLSKYKEWL